MLVLAVDRKEALAGAVLVVAPVAIDQATAATNNGLSVRRLSHNTL